MKILKEFHLSTDIIVDKFDGIVSNITTSINLTFSDDDFPAAGKDHNNALNITVRCINVKLSRVLIDIGSSLNILPKIVLVQLELEGVIV